MGFAARYVPTQVQVYPQTDSVTEYGGGIPPDHQEGVSGLWWWSACGGREVGEPRVGLVVLYANRSARSSRVGVVYVPVFCHARPMVSRPPARRYRVRATRPRR
jgi:hypothetical protein